MSMTGSSPLTRGKRWRRFSPWIRRGLIPAHAGKTQSWWGRRAPLRAHPRSRGENETAAANASVDAGSSPLTRGKLSARLCDAHDVGLIPAHAGKTLPANSGCVSRRAHPRSRGENFTGLAATLFTLGSSPLTRGKRSPQRCSVASSQAHPRSRGENCCCYFKCLANWGSSPLTRGKHFLTCAFIAQIGQILESLELCASSESYSSPEAYATDALQGRVRSIDLGLRSSRGAS